MEKEYDLEEFKLDTNGVVLIPKGWTMEIPKGAITGPLKLTYFATLDDYIRIPVADIIINGKRFYKSDIWDYGRFFLIEY